MDDAVEWEWRVEDPTPYAAMEFREVHVAYALGEPVRLVAFGSTGSEPGDEPDDALASRMGVTNPFGVRVNPDGTAWFHCAIYTIEREGIPGIEILEEFLAKDEAFAAVETDRAALIEMVRENNG